MELHVLLRNTTEPQTARFLIYTEKSRTFINLYPEKRNNVSWAINLGKLVLYVHVYIVSTCVKWYGLYGMLSIGVALPLLSAFIRSGNVFSRVCVLAR